MKKTKFYLEGLLHEIGLIYITNKLHHRTVLCTDFIHGFYSLQNFRNSLVRYAHSFVSKVLRLVNKNPYGALSMK